MTEKLPASVPRVPNSRARRLLLLKVFHQSQKETETLLTAVRSIVLADSSLSSVPSKSLAMAHL